MRTHLDMNYGSSSSHSKGIHYRCLPHFIFSMWLFQFFIHTKKKFNFILHSYAWDQCRGCFYYNFNFLIFVFRIRKLKKKTPEKTVSKIHRTIKRVSNGSSGSVFFFGCVLCCMSSFVFSICRAHSFFFLAMSLLFIFKRIKTGDASFWRALYFVCLWEIFYFNAFSLYTECNE